MLTEEDRIRSTINFIDAKNELVRFIRDSEEMDRQMQGMMLQQQIEWYWLDEQWAETFNAGILYPPLCGI